MLDKTIIENGINSLQDNNPDSIQTAAKKWAQFLFDYATGAMAGETTPVFAGYPELLESVFLSTMGGKVFIETLGTSLQPMWQLAVWSSAAFTGTTTLVSGPTLDASLKILSEEIKSGNKDSAKEIANTIDLWTKTIMVTLTNNQSGATTVVPVS